MAKAKIDVKDLTKMLENLQKAIEKKKQEDTPPIAKTPVARDSKEARRRKSSMGGSSLDIRNSMNFSQKSDN